MSMSSCWIVRGLIDASCHLPYGGGCAGATAARERSA